MSAEAVGRYMPGVITLDDLAAMNEADTHGYRYETSVEGALSVVPPPGSDHQIIIGQLFLWLAAAGWTAEQAITNVGIRIPGRNVDAGRIPDLAVWAQRPSSGVYLPTTDLLLAIEVISPASAAIDQLTKVGEYAGAGIPQYWTVDRDADNTVTVFRLGDEGIYRTIVQKPLADLLQSSPDEFLPGPADS
jgi:Uma2 family endonuclease